MAPIYTTYILETGYDPELGRLKYFPRRNYELENGIYRTPIQLMKEVIESSIENIQGFPMNRLFEIIDDVNFQDIPMGKFNFFNAFFLNDYTTRFA